MNNIIEIQNTDESLLLLAAQRSIYSGAKKILFIKEIMIVIIPILLALVYSIYPLGTPYFKLYSFIIIFVDMMFFESIVSKKKKAGALIQELFDTGVLCLNNSLLQYNYPFRSEIEFAAKKISKKKEFKNWYNVAIEILPLEVARLVCQKINVDWDGKIRRKSINIVLIFIAVISFTIIVKGIWDKYLLEDFISVLVMLIPFYRYYVKFTQDQIKAVRELSDIEQSIDIEIEEYIIKKDTEKANQNSRIIQDHILLGRLQYPLTSDILYRLSKPFINEHNSIDIKDFVKKIDERLTEYSGVKTSSVRS